MTSDIDRFEAAKTTGYVDAHTLYRGVYAAGIPALALSQHVDKDGLFDSAFPSGEALDVDAFNGYHSGLALAETEVLEQGVRL